MMAPSFSLRSFRVQAGAAAILAIFFLLWLRNEWGGPTATRYFSNLAQLAVAAAASYACLRRADHPRTTVPGAWRLMGAACAAWAGGQGVWSYYELVLGVEAPDVSAADVGFLLFIPAAMASLFAFSSFEPRAPARWRALLDGLVAAVALLFVSWYFVLGRVFEEAGGGVLDLAVNAAYPLGDVVLLSLALFTFARAPPNARRRVGVLAAGIAVLSIADSWFLYLLYADTYATGHIVDAAWLVGFQLIGLAAMTPPTPQADPTPIRESLVAATPALPFVVALATAVVAYVREGGLSPFLFWTALTFIVLVVARQSLLVADNIGLKRRAERAVEALEEQRQARTRMLNQITHDLVSPLTPVRIQLHLLDQQALDDEQRKAVDITRRNIERVLHMATDLKDLANMEEKKLRFDPVAADLAALARSAVESLMVQAEPKGITLRVDATGPAAVTVDPARVQQVLYNLLANALKFTPEGGSITIRVMRTPQRLWRVAVTDTGRGLAPDEQARLFQPFVQVHDRLDQEVADRGTGLGLFICKGIVEAHGGRIGVESPGRGHGSTFWFTLPEGEAGPAPGAPRSGPPAPG